MGACLQRNLRRRCQYSGYGCLLLCLALLLTACGSKVRLPPLAEDGVILAFGDSLTYGTGANEAESYPAVLEGLIKRKVVAAGIPGETSAEGLARLADALESVEPQLLMLCHGGNDLLRRSGEAAAEANLRAMVRLARERGIDVVLIGVPRPGVRLAAAGFYEKIAADNGLVILRDALADILGDNALKADLAHPNAAGYRKLAREIAALLKRAGAV